MGYVGITEGKGVVCEGQKRGLLAGEKTVGNKGVKGHINENRRE